MIEWYWVAIGLFVYTVAWLHFLQWDRVECYKIGRVDGRKEGEKLVDKWTDQRVKASTASTIWLADQVKSSPIYPNNSPAEFLRILRSAARRLHDASRCGDKTCTSVEEIIQLEQNLVAAGSALSYSLDLHDAQKSSAASKSN